MHFIGESDIEEETETNENAYGVELVNSDNQNRNKRWLVNLDLKAKTERSSVSTCCQLDSGSTCNVMTGGCYKRIAIGTPMDKTDVKLRFYDGSMKPALGQCKLKCFHNNEKFILIFQIIEGPSSQYPLISAEACERLRLVRRILSITRSNTEATEDSIIQQFSDVLEGLECLTGKCSIEIDATIRPVQQPPRRVPVPLKERLKAKIEESEYGSDCTSGRAN